MVERTLFASFYTLQQGRYHTIQFKAGASVSVVAHIVFFTLIYSVGLGPQVSQEVMAGDQAEAEVPAGEIVEVYGGRLILPPPEVIRQLLGEIKPGQPTRADFIAERSSIARGDITPNPPGPSQLSRSDGRRRHPPSAEAASADSATRASDESSPGKREQEVAESRDRLPTVTPQPTPRDDHQPAGRSPAGAGENSQIAKLESPAPEAPTTPQDSVVTVRGPISVNARGVGPIEEYRAYLERVIQQRWQIPPEANLLDKPVSLTVEFVIAQDGRLVSLRLHNSTGIRALDRAAIRAIELASPFRPLPSAFTTPTQVFTDTFVYYPPSSS